MPAFKQGFEEPLEDHHLSARIDELFVHDWLVRPQIEGPVEQERVRTHFAQLHHDVLQMHIIHLLYCSPSQFNIFAKQAGDARLVLNACSAPTSAIDAAGAMLLIRLLRVRRPT